MPSDVTRKLLAAVSSELAEASDDCGKLQHLISSLLDKTDHPDLVAEFHMIQDLDRMNQTLADLSGLVLSIAKAMVIDADNLAELSEGLKLASLRGRLFPENAPASDDDSEQITFF
ncbi:MAG: hypothetical protein VX874_01550 [Pseudomonadota bacterium]|nr:hypothetical protein [Pseudomonadota bacterium]